MQNLIEMRTEHLGLVKLRIPTVGEAIDIMDLPKKEQAIKMAAMALVEPNLTEEDIRRLPMTHLEDITRIVARVSGDGADA